MTKRSTKPLKTSEEFDKTWRFYFLSQHDVKFSGVSDEFLITKWRLREDKENGRSPKDCYWYLTSKGWSKSCNDLRTLLNVLHTKAAWDIQIKMWAAGVRELTLPPLELKEYLREYQETPEWVYEAVINHAIKM